MKSLSLVLPFLFVATACSSTTGDGTSSPTPTNIVRLTATTFEPATITIKAGETVTWRWETGLHDVESGTNCSPDGTFSSGVPASGADFEHKFDTAGTFDYFCSVHCGSGMVGKVIVQ